MLSFARGAARNVGQASVRQAIECARTILKDGLDRAAIQVTVDVEADLRAVPRQVVPQAVSAHHEIAVGGAVAGVDAAAELLHAVGVMLLVRAADGV